MPVTGFTAYDVPTSDVEMVADLVRLCRAAPDGARGAQVMDHLRSMHPEADDATVKRVAGWTARLLTDKP